MYRSLILLSSILFSLNTFSSEKVTIVTYNVYNLFDANHDENKNDWQYLPLNYPGKTEACEQVSVPRYRKSCLETDWNDTKFEAKLESIKSALMNNVESLPDFLALVEVENENVVKKLAMKLGYENWLVTDSPDKRGIDVALLYNESKNVTFMKVKEHEIHNKKNDLLKPTRNILEGQFRIFGKKTIIFVNHWPSQASPASARVEVARQLKKKINWRKLTSPKAHIILTGDFNVIPSDFPHPFHKYLFSGLIEFSDVDTLFRSSAEIPNEKKNALPLGTYFYARKMAWNMLDLFFVTKNLNNGTGLEINLEGYNILTKGITRPFTYSHGDNYNFGTTINAIPYRYDFTSSTGFSDHFPVKLELIMK